MPTTISGTTGVSQIQDSTITNADINTNAAIAGTKINPNFGNQNVVSTGDFTLGNTNVFGTFTSVTPSFGGLNILCNVDVGACEVIGRRSRGTFLSPTVIGSQDNILTIAGQGYEGTGYRNSAWIKFRSAGTPTINNVPGDIIFGTTSLQAGQPSPTNPQERMRITSNGIVGVGTSTEFAFNNTFVANMGLAATTETGSTLTPTIHMIRRDNAAGLKNMRIANYPGGHFVVEHVNDAYTVSTNLLYIEGSPNRGRVGIGGITTPDQMLTVAGNASKSAGGTTWATYSDIRIKKDITIADTDRCYEIIKNLPLKRYTLKDEIFSTQEVKDRSKLGWIAQDIESFFPKGVYKNTTTFSPTKLSADNVVIEDCMSFDADQIYAVMYGAVQKLINKIETLEAKITELESK